MDRFLVCLQVARRRPLNRTVRRAKMTTLSQQIDEAWDQSPYPGDDVLSDCWCEECEDAMSLIRGKSWMELTADDLDLMHSRMEPDAFLYYLPGLLYLAIDSGSEYLIADRVCAEFVVADIGDPSQKLNIIRHIISGLTEQQRAVLIAFFNWMRSRDWTADLLIDCACDTITSGNPKPFSADALDHWVRQRVAQNADEP